jgi:two-component system KDP operon response regulator KdpE
MATRILAVDDEHEIRLLLRVSLEAEKYEVCEASTGRAAIESVRVRCPDLILLDLGLPDMDGVSVTRFVRQSSRIPILILSVRSSELDKIAALDAGADDYLTKPFAPGELGARIRALLRRAGARRPPDVYQCRDVKIDLLRHTVEIGGASVQLTPTEFELLALLVRHAGKVLHHRQLIRELWGGRDYEDEFHLLRVNVSNLRRKIEADPARPRFVITEPGVGYRLRDE